MKITMITGSPHKKGTSALLAERFRQGAEESGHEVFQFDSAFEEVKPCIGCGTCREQGKCIHKDSMERLIPEMLESDAIVFVMPLYYFGMPAQIKAVMDRFYFPESNLTGKRKTALLATAYNPDMSVMEALVVQYKKLFEYMKWEDGGMILACGCGIREQIEESEYPEQAYLLGKEML